jgi:5'-phosphate synthase pdxT subunit
VVVCGVLALQGGWDAHGKILQELGAEVQSVRTAADLDTVECLVIPGGESTAMLRLMEPERLNDRLTERVSRGMAVLATCAGVILLAEHVEPEQESLGILAAAVERNAYGRQVHSTIDQVALAPEVGDPALMEGVFIRAPRLTRLGPEVVVLGRLRDEPVLVRQDRIIGATFHPELTTDRRVHELFLNMAEEGHG